MINVVLYEPEIFGNTANIIRTCSSTGAKLHIIKPTSFYIHPHWFKRNAAGRFLSEIPHEIHKNYSEFHKKYADKHIFYITRYGLTTYSDIDFKKEMAQEDEVWIMFGTESTGIPRKIMQQDIDRCLRIPMTPHARSINLSNSVSVVLYEVLRQLDFEHLSKEEVQKGKYFILQKD